MVFCNDMTSYDQCLVDKIIRWHPHRWGAVIGQRLFVCSCTWIGKIPGRMGQVMPMSRQSLTNLRKVSALKKSWVTMKCAPASTFSSGAWRHLHSSPPLGGPWGNLSLHLWWVWAGEFKMCMQKLPWTNRFYFNVSLCFFFANFIIHQVIAMVVVIFIANTINCLSF